MRGLFLALGLLPGLAQANCPVASDLENGGIRVVASDDSVETFVRVNEHVVQSELLFEPGEGIKATFAKGLYVLETMPIEDGKVNRNDRSGYIFGMANKDLPDPQPETEFTLQVSFFVGQDFRAEPQVFTFFEKEMLTIGTCKYEVIPVVVDYGGKEALVETYLYSEKLGISFFVQSEQNRELEFRVKFTDIRAVNP